MRYFTLACLLLCAATALGQMSMGGDFTAMDVEAKEAVGNISGRFDSLTGDVRITLRSEDTAVTPVVIEADKMEFTYAAEQVTSPVKIVLSGNVHIPSPDPEIKSIESRQAVWSMVTNEVTFTGDVVLTRADDSRTKCGEARINLQTGDFRLSGGFEMADFNLVSNNRPSDPSLIQKDDVKDWTPIVTALKEGMGSETPSPGRRVAGLLNETLQGYLKNMPTASIVENGDALRKEVNKLLPKPGLYDAASWKGTDLGGEARALLDNASRDAAQTTRLNRLLLEAAWPDAFAGAQ